MAKKTTTQTFKQSDDNKYNYSVRTENGTRYDSSGNAKRISQKRQLNLAGDVMKSTASYASVGTSIGSMFGGVGAGIGAAVGGVVGLVTSWIFGHEQQRENDRNTRNQLINARDEEQNNRNIAIKNAKETIDLTRSNIDNTYGTGTFADFNALFSSVFNMPEGSSSLMQFLNSMDYDTVGGTINTSSVDANVVEGGAMSLSDIKGNYLEYFRQQLGAADTAFGIQMRQYDAQAMNLVNSYEQSIDSMQLQTAQSFANAFLNRQAEQIQGEQSMGQASLQQATSGLRQTAGSGQVLTNMQKFQNDLADIAYASLLDYSVKSYEASAKNTMSDMQYQMYSIRASKNQSIQSALASAINSYNQANSSSKTSKKSIDDSEEFVTETNEEIIDYSESLGEYEANKALPTIY